MATTRNKNKPLAPTGKLAAWLFHYLDETNEKTFLNKTQSAFAAKYKVKPKPYETDEEKKKEEQRQYLIFGNIGYQNYKKLEYFINKWIDKNGFSETRIKSKLLEGADAFETKFFQKDGIVLETRNVIAWETRRKYLDMMIRIKDMYAAEKYDVGGELKLNEEDRKIAKDFAQSFAENTFKNIKGGKE